MDESYFKERISGYFDNNLPPDEHQLVEDFLKNSEEGRRMLDELGRLDEFVARHSDLSGSDDVWEARASKIEAALGFLEESEPVVTDITPSRWSWWGWKGAAVAASAALLVFIGINQTDIFDTDQITPPSPKMTPQVSPQAESGDIIIDIDGADYQPSVDSVATKGPASTKPKIQAPAVGIPKPVADDGVSVATRDDVPPPAPSRIGASSTQTVKKSSPIPPSDKDTPETVAKDELAEMSNLVEKVGTETGSPDLGSTATEAERGAVRATTQSLQLAPRQEVSDLSKSIEVTGEPVERDSLAYWRTRRDSLETALKSSNEVGVAPKATDLLKSSYGQAAKESNRIQAEQTESALVEALYNVAILSKDEVEKQAAIGRLKAIAGDSKSANQAVARRNLDNLKRP